MKTKKFPVVTLGSPNGIGYEIFLRTVKKKLIKNTVLYAAGSASFIDFYSKLLKMKFNYLAIKNKNPKFPNSSDKFDFILINTDHEKMDIKNIDLISDKIDGLSALNSIDTAARLVKQGLFSSIVTLPVSKKNISLFSRSFIGHTEFFQKKWNEKSVFMTFVSKKINVLLLTTHVPLKKISKSINSRLVIDGILAAEKLRIKLGLNKKLCFLGLNPHAGEEGLLGKEDVKIKKIIQKIQIEKKIKIDGPIPADTAFTKESLANHSIFISCYHDQGLIPFKMFSFQNGVNLSFGMKYVRTSVDHGTAKNIIGKNKADLTSFINAYKLALKLS